MLRSSGQRALNQITYPTTSVSLNTKPGGSRGIMVGVMVMVE